jgi:circadian clock protein KaiC
MSIDRLPTGIEGLDTILDGGIIKNRTYLLVGAAGTGKTLFGMQWLLEGVQNKDKSMYITLTESANDIIKNCNNFNWETQEIDFLDLSPDNIPGFALDEYQIFNPEEVEDLGIWEKIYRAVKDKKPNRLVIDSATQLRYSSMDEYQFRKHINGLVKILNSLDITSIVFFEPTELVREASTALAVDGIFKLRFDISASQVTGLRTFEVNKFRGSNFLSGYHALKINNSGIHIFPHVIEKTGGHLLDHSVLSFGIDQLDNLLKGGLESGTTTMISGASGVGKTTVALKFLSNSCCENAKGVLFAFEESPDCIHFRSKKLNIQLEEKIKSGIVKIVRINPLEINPDELLEIIRNLVEKEHYKIVVIDSLRGYQLAMEEFGSIVAHMQNMVTFLNRLNITTILINEVVNITGNMQITELGISHLADNIILIRYAELNSQLIKVICCLKKRLGDFEPELRQLKIDQKGIHVGEKLENLHGILSGIPNSAY